MLTAVPKPNQMRRAKGKWPWVIPNVELFHDGSWREGTEEEFHCSPDDIDDMVRNFRIFASGERPSLEPGLGIGHTDPNNPDAEVFADDSELNFGAILSPRVAERDIDGQPKTFLVGDLGLTDEAAEMFRTGKVRRISLEVLDDPPDGCDGGEGYTITRAALLGLAPPELKRLKPPGKPIPMGGTFPKRRFSQSTVRRQGRRLYIFSDLPRGKAMRDELISWLTENGFDPMALKIDDSTPDEQIAALVDALKPLAGDTGEEEVEEVEEEPMEFADEFLDEEEELDPVDDLELKGQANMSHKFSDRTLSRELRTVSSNLLKLTSAFEADRRNERKLRKTETANRVRTFCDQMVKQGKMSPASAEEPSEDNPHGGEDYARLQRALSDKRVHTFSDKRGKKTTKTSLEVEMETIERRPVHRFSAERMGVRKTAGSGVSEFREALRKKLGTSKN